MDGSGSRMISGQDGDDRLYSVTTIPVEGKDQMVAHINSGSCSKRVSLDSNTLPVDARSQTNVLLHINNIPEEIILHVFTCLIPSIRSIHFQISDSYRICLNVTHVCQHWRNVALGSPKIWSKVVYTKNTNEKLIRLFLERSRMADLEVSFEVTEGPLFTDILQLFLKQMYRVLSLCITTAGKCELVQDFLRRSGPQLKYLHLCNDRHETQGLDFLSHPPPSVQLVELVIDRIYLPWNSSILRGLSSLIVSDCPRPTLSNLLDILESCPTLRNLHFRRVYIGFTENSRKRSIDLPHLESVILNDIDFKAYHILLDYVIIPKDVEWIVTCDNCPIEQPELFISSLPERTEQCKSFKITYSLTSLEITSNGALDPYTSLFYDWDRIATPRLTLDLLRSMTKTIVAQPFWNNAIALEVESNLDYDIANEAFWSSIFVLLPHIRSLRICYETLNCELPQKGLIGVLTEPTDCDPQSPGWPCPDLEKLEFSLLDFSTPEAQQLYKKLIDHLHLRRDHGRGLRELNFIYCYEIGEKEARELRRLKVAREIDVCNDESEGWNHINT